MGSFLDSKFPVFIPVDQALFFSNEEFNNHVAEALKHGEAVRESTEKASITLPVRDVKPNSNPSVANASDDGKSDNVTDTKMETDSRPAATFMEGLKTFSESNPSPDPNNTMRTENNDLAVKDTKSPLVDLFFELEDLIGPTQLDSRLDAAWKEDPLATLKIIFNARSIHLGKSSRPVFYRCCGWLAEHHPRTLLHNLTWLVRPVIAKKKPVDKTKENEEADKDSDDDMVVVEADDVATPNDEGVVSYDVKHGMAHGYWKDLLNILALAVNDQLKVDGDCKSVLNVAAPKPYQRDWTPGKERRDAQKENRHTRAIKKLKDDPFYRSLHLTIARLFADQLRVDTALLQTGKASDARRISLAGKWAPTTKEFHDKHTFIASTIAELLHSREIICPQVPEDDRELYLKHAREAYRKSTISPLRKALELVERDITAKSYQKIKYDRVPSLAMDRYSKLFMKKDSDRFDKYIEAVAGGKRKISGAVLLPSTLVKKALETRFYGKRGNTEELLNNKLADMEAKVLDGQWKSLVNRIKESGTLESSIAICDVSGSMQSPTFADGTRPVDSAIGLSLLLAEVTAEPFGGSFITFSSDPEVQKVGGLADTRSFAEKVRSMNSAPWGMNTNFVAVFERLILPMAVKHKLPAEHMVKQVFVFSDMHFDQAAPDGHGPWKNSYERIKRNFEHAGYAMPKLIFWNLAGGRSGEDAPKPVDSDEDGTALVSGYSQGQLKVFLDGAGFEDPEEAVDIAEEEEVDEDGEVVVNIKKKQKMDPLIVVKKAISHKAYAMLEVVD